MKENMLDVLMYLFDHYISDQEYHLDQSEILTHLEEVGFNDTEVSRALEWLQGLDQHDSIPLSSQRYTSLRIYTSEEAQLLGAEGIGFLLNLEHNQVLDLSTREKVLERVWALGLNEVELDQLKWVVLMVLFNQPDQKYSLSWLEDLIFSTTPETVH